MSHLSIELTLFGDACTDAALAFLDPDEEDGTLMWIPRSQIHNLDRLLDGLPAGSLWGTKETVEIEIPQWLAEEKGLDIYAEETEDEVE